MVKKQIVASLLVSSMWSAPACASGHMFKVTLAQTDPSLKCGARQTPKLSLGPPPAGTKSLAIIFWDRQGSHLSGRWTVYDLPLSTRNLSPTAASSAQVAGARVAINEAGKLGYTAPCGPGRHDVYIDFYALDTASLNLPTGAPLQRVHAAIKRHKRLEAKAHVMVSQ